MIPSFCIVKQYNSGNYNIISIITQVFELALTLLALLQQLNIKCQLIATVGKEVTTENNCFKLTCYISLVLFYNIGL